MLNANQIQSAKETAEQHFGEGFHCAEAVAWAVLEALGEETESAAAHATAFGGGFGRTFEEACGAISGGLIAIGHLHGRRKPEGEWDLPANLGAELRARFMEEFDTSNCAVLRERFGKEEQMQECRKVVGTTVTSLLEMLDRGESRVECTCCAQTNRHGD